MKLGTLEFNTVYDHFNLVSKSVKDTIVTLDLKNIFVAEINDTLADTSAFCEHYEIGLDVSANCVVLEAKKADRLWHVACVVLATTRADVNSSIRKYITARKVSFASMDAAVSMTGMEYGGITPIGLPVQWPLLIDEKVIQAGNIVIGSGLRKSKVLLPGTMLTKLPTAQVLSIAK